MSSLEAPHFEPVVATLEASGLDPEMCIIHGGAVLARWGLREAGDVDLLLKPRYYHEIAEAGQTPGGLALEQTDTIKGRSRLVSADASAEGHMPLDMSTFAGLGLVMGVRFAHHRALAERVTSRIGVLNIAMLAYMLNQKSHNGCAKDQADVHLIHQHFDGLLFGAGQREVLGEV